ncbi:10796_t:CDS:2 [Funneliformis mosseae]|uniref:10796_t:CDS:1 n=1 Tax=Funneliformis mosseae TaxID=27381 RepID=A0A9N9CF87_FUNMO|nr:10796_t:CDS:2 [Funneliformis mosseae]
MEQETNTREEEKELNYNEQLEREKKKELNYNEQLGEVTIKEIKDQYSIDISSLTTYKPEFLSEEFGDFIKLLTRWNLSDTCSSDIFKFACKICCNDNLIIRWVTCFVKLLKVYSPLGLRLPKLYNWYYHIITTIKEHEAINSFTTDTYESLHKDAIEKPYRASNKCNVIDQMIKTVGSRISSTSIKRVFDLCEGLTDMKNTIIRWHSYTNIASSRDYIRVKSKYYNELSFSNVSINMSNKEIEDYNTVEDTCFSKILILINIEIKNYLSFDLNLV